MCHKWNLIEDIAVCSEVLSCVDNYINKRAVKNLLAIFPHLTESQIRARANNYKHLIDGTTKFWKVCCQERKVFDALIKSKVYASGWKKI